MYILHGQKVDRHAWCLSDVSDDPDLQASFLRLLPAAQNSMAVELLVGISQFYALQEMLFDSQDP